MILSLSYLTHTSPNFTGVRMFCYYRSICDDCSLSVRCLEMAVITYFCYISRPIGEGGPK